MDRKRYVTDREVRYEEYLNRDIAFWHHSYADDAKQYALLKAGDPSAVEMGALYFQAEGQGHLSDDPLQNIKYLFVASAALASRAALSGGMPQEKAYNASDLYIRRMDRCTSVEEVQKVHNEMFTYYTEEMAALDRKKVFSRHIMKTIDYILEHLNESLTVPLIAEHVKLSPAYLSALFKKETGSSISEYISEKRIETACSMLRYSDFSCVRIAAALGFSSQSHFTQVFRERKGCTPAAYRKQSCMEG